MLADYNTRTLYNAPESHADHIDDRSEGFDSNLGILVSTQLFEAVPQAKSREN